ncbi:MAG: hypothetical protein FWE08_09010 [Oscillospiraceae bacterium]|nr:hypothetical protein [Oscillospiraceae bacterium]
MKKIILLAIVLLVIVAFAACSGAQALTQEETVSEHDSYALHAQQEHDSSIYEPLRQGVAWPEWMNTEPDRLRQGAAWPEWVNVDELVFRHAETRADSPWFDGVHEMLDRGPIDIVRVEVLNNGEGRWICYAIDPCEESIYITWLRPMSLIHTVYQLRVVEVFHGSVQVGDIIEVALDGGELEGLTRVRREVIPFTDGYDLILFLIPVDGLPHLIASYGFGVYRFPSPDDGARAFALEADESVERIVVNDIDRFTLTIDDLINLQIESFGRLSESFEALLVEDARR